MKLCIVTPDEEYLSQAGTRIRYQRVAAGLTRQGIELTLEVIDQLRTGEQLQADAYLFSKCNDVRGVLMAHLVRDQGKLVGIDLFDDYFSQSYDSRAITLRDWLRSMSGALDFFLCSTPRMHEVGQSLLEGVPGHVLNDPFDDASPERIAAAIARHLERVRGDEIDVAWFGVGDNPRFPVGLHDLWAYGHELTRLAVGGRRVRLHILTNRRALTADALERLRRLPVAWDLDEWTLEGEQGLLATCPIAFVPVNAQSFSIAKSLNRGVTALTAGCQLLSPGYPLYGRLDPLVYGSAVELASDLETGRPRLRAETVPVLQRLMADLGDPEIESGRLAGFLKRLSPGHRRAAVRPSLYGVIHGAKSLGVIHQLTQRLRQISIGGPMSASAPNYDLRIMVGDENGLPIQLSERALKLCAASWRRRARPGTSPTGRPIHEVVLSSARSVQVRSLVEAHQWLSKATQRAAVYDTLMDGTAALVASCFPGIFLLRSEVEAPLHHLMQPVRPALRDEELFQ
jgi:hypothetical protein